MAGSNGLIDWQAKLGMTLIGIGAVGLFASTRDWISIGGVIDYILITLALFGILLLLLSMSIDSENEELSQTSTLVPEEFLHPQDDENNTEEE